MLSHRSRRCDNPARSLRTAHPIDGPGGMLYQSRKDSLQAAGKVDERHHILGNAAGDGQYMLLNQRCGL